MASSNIFSVTVKEVSTQDVLEGNLNGNVIATRPAISTFWSMLDMLGILVACTVVSSVQSLIPRHNSILDPEYWFEINIPVGMGLFLMTAVLILECIILTENKSLVSTRLFLKLYFSLFGSWITLYCLSYMSWSGILKRNHPMPFIGLISYFPTKILSICSFLLLSPPGHVTEKRFKENQKNFLFYEFLWIAIILLNESLSVIYTKLEHTDFQCTIAILIQLFKRLAKVALSKIMNKMVGTENERANVLLGVSINITYGLFVATRLAGARISTVISLVIVDLFMQLMITHKIANLHTKVNVWNEMIENEKRKEILKLILAEMCEGLVPLVYALCFAMSYYGPNSHLIGNVGIRIWGYKAVDDATRTFLVLFGMFGFDLVSLLINAMLIWSNCKINILREFCVVLQKYWYIILLEMNLGAYLYFLSKDINLAYDWTFDFCWTINNKMLTMNCNSTT